jgi:hypothetical protein
MRLISISIFNTHSIFFFVSLFNGITILLQEIMKSCPKKDIENFKDLLKEENLYLTIEVINFSLELNFGLVFLLFEFDF